MPCTTTAVILKTLRTITPTTSPDKWYYTQRQAWYTLVCFHIVWWCRDCDALMLFSLSVRGEFPPYLGSDCIPPCVIMCVGVVMAISMQRVSRAVEAHVTARQQIAHVFTITLDQTLRGNINEHSTYFIYFMFSSYALFFSFIVLLKGTSSHFPTCNISQHVVVCVLF